MSLKVLAPGLQTLLVDFGRPGSRSLGVPVGGAADRFALAIGNALVGNPPNTVALEVNLSGPTLEAECPVACVLWGAPYEIYRNERALRPGYTFNLESGDLVRIGGCRQGARAYLCLRGGIEAPLFLASRSAITPLQAGESCPCSSGKMRGRTVRGPWIWNRDPSVPCVRAWRFAGGLGFLPATFTINPFPVAPASTRMGLRLIGRPLTQKPTEIVSGARSPRNRSGNARRTMHRVLGCRWTNDWRLSQDCPGHQKPDGQVRIIASWR